MEFLKYDIDIIYTQRLLIITLIFLFCYFVNKNLILKKKYVLYSLYNFSFVLLICIIITPLILLEKTKSQETRFVELIGNDLIEQEEDKAIFLISNELSDLSVDNDIEKNIKDNYKSEKLAYYLWKKSKINNENFNSALIVLDTSKKIISDFSVNSSSINTDSVVNFVKKKYFEVKIQTYIPDSEIDTNTTEFAAESESEENQESIYMPVMFENINILRNSENKFYVGIIPIENQSLKNTQFAENIGYLLIAIHSQSRNLMPDASFQALSNYSMDNLTERLISKPVFTEFINGEVTSSTDPDVSRGLLKSLDNFREYMHNLDKSTYWRYEIINNSRYRTYYLMSKSKESTYSDFSKIKPEKIFAISLKRDDFKITAFYYLRFILFTLLIYLTFFITFSLIYLIKFRRINFNFRDKLFVSFLFVSIIPIIILALYTRSYIIDKNENFFNNQIISDLNLVNENLKDEKIIASMFKSTDTLKKLTKNILIKNYANTDKNFNFFYKNKLISSTNEELFKSDLIDTRIDAEAYYNIVLLKKDFYTVNQEVGGLNFMVGYKALKDRGNSVIGILSTISVYKQKEINEELSETLTFIFGSYCLVIIIVLLIVGLLTHRIYKPILELKIATDKLSRGESNIEIKLERNDELGDLVDSFNKMTKELEKSKSELKKAEREAAWRDIARRVAHEIKNPLTPMKLAIQHLNGVYKEKNSIEFEKILGKTKELISKEIDKLNRIATEFSNFAKLPRKNYEQINVNEIINDVISLYSLDINIEFIKELSDYLKPIEADREELNRAFQNLVKNAVQSIKGSGKVTIKSYYKGEFVFVEIIDTGTVIEADVLKKLFEPNFSTKSQGMGLGLAITKKTLDDMKAVIEFESKINIGTKVLVKFFTVQINLRPREVMMINYHLQY